MDKKEQQLIKAIKKANPVNLRRSLRILENYQSGSQEAYAFIEGIEILQIALEISEKR